jgi:hypothetical protein
VKQSQSDGDRAVLTPDQGISTPGSMAIDTAERLNHECFCISLDRPSLMQKLDAEVGTTGFAAALAATHPSLFSNVPVFVSQDTISAMESVVTAVETAAQLPGFHAAAMAWAPPIALADLGPVGALMGYDFHITADGPRLIEVNTNAGGAFLNHTLAVAQRACCREVQSLVGNLEPPRAFGEQILAMFTSEWRRQGRSGRPSTLAIVDDDPDGQFMLPEFKLARAVLEAGGIRTIIADAGPLDFNGTTLTSDGLAIDLVYNRLVDFGLAESRHAALRAAYEADKVVVTPNPHNHALLADKRNLTLLSDVHMLERWGLEEPHRKTLEAAVPATTIVDAANAETLWADRRNWFFKPAGGHGSKATYRGEKVTRKVWSDIIAGGYVAQAYAAPSHRMIVQDGAPSDFKLDVRLYTYAGGTLLVAARLYQGQTTNMRTPGGGFAPVLEVATAIPAPA